MLPLVSVLMPLYNTEEYVREAVDSILSQRFEDFELIVLDDGSTDASASIVSSYTDKRVRFIQNSANTGLAAVRNKALSLARGRYVAWLDSDDCSFPGRLLHQVKVLEENAEIGLCGSWVQTIGLEAGCVWPYPTDPGMVRSIMLFGNPLATSATMMRRAAAEEMGLRFDPRFAPSEDYDFWEKISRRWLATNVTAVLTGYRLHSAQVSKLKEAQQRAAAQAVQQRLLLQLGISPTDVELQLHSHVASGGRLQNSRDAVSAAEAWLLKLAHANQKSRAFPEASFRQMLSDRWRSIINANSRGRIRDLIKYHRSPLVRSLSW